MPIRFVPNLGVCGVTIDAAENVPVSTGECPLCQAACGGSGINPSNETGNLTREGGYGLGTNRIGME